MPYNHGISSNEGTLWGIFSEVIGEKIPSEIKSALCIEIMLWNSWH